MGGDCLARVSDRENEESLEEPSGRRLSVSQESQSLCLLTEKVRRV